jgi:glycosyltransferase involved in cell wall biosynthesis
MKDKILIVCHSLSCGGGAEKVLSILIKELCKHYSITVIERLESIARYDLPTTVNKLKSMSYTKEYVRQQKKGYLLYHFLQHRILAVATYLFPSCVYKHYIKGAFDIEISFNYLYPSFLIANSPNKKSRKIMWIHGTIFDLDFRQYKGVKRILYYFYHRMQYLAFKKADTITSISQYTYCSIAQIYPNFINKTKIIHNGYDFEEIEKNAIARKDENTSPKHKVIAVGRLDKNKNFLLQIEAIKILCKRNIDVELFILGDGEEKNKMEAKIRELELTDRVILKGYIPNPYPYIKSADALIVSSYCEGFPTVIVEALALGIPVVSTHVGGVDELIKDGINGYKVDMTAKAMADCTEKVLQKNWESEAIKESVKQYTKECWVNNVIQLLEDGKL